MSTYHRNPTSVAPANTGGWHAVNIGHLVMGLAFLGLAGVWAAVELGAVPDDDIRWLLPLPWVVAGAAGLVASAVASGLRWRRTSPPADPAGTDGPTPAHDAPLSPDHTSDLDEKLARYDVPEENR